MRDLLVTTHTPVLGSGRALRTYTIARALAARGGLDLLYLRFEGDQPDASFSAIGGVRMHPVESSRGPRRLLAYARGRLAGIPAAVARGISPELAAAASRLSAAPERGRVIADGPVAAVTLAKLARRRAVIYNAHNFESGFRHEQGMPPTASPAAVRAFERGILERASESWMVSETDLASAHELCPSAKLRYVPNAVDVAAIEPVDPSTSERRAIFVANFSYPPNQIGLRFMLDQVLPRVWAELPEALLALVGGGLAGPPSKDPRVETLGFVEDLRGAYSGAACAVVPLLFGGGTPLKLIEALAYGVPVLATSRAAAGLAVRDGVHCLIADGPEAFAAALVALLREGHPDLARRGRELALGRYSVEALTELLAEDRPTEAGPA